MKYFFNSCSSGAILHINLVTCMQPPQSAYLLSHLNGICSSLPHEHHVSFCSWIYMGMSVLKRKAGMLGRQQAGFLGLSSVSPGLETGHQMVPCASPPSLPAVLTSVQQQCSGGFCSHPGVLCEMLSYHFTAWKGKFLIIFSPLGSQGCEVLQ